MIDGMEAWFTFGVITLMFLALLREWLEADVAFFSALVVLWVAGVVDVGHAFAGFSNPQVLTIGLLFIVSAAMQETGALQGLSHFMLGRQLDRKRVLARLLFPVAAISSFLNNTPIVAMFTPMVRDWALRNGRSPSKFLIPLSYATILGGTCTLIGTSTNLIVSGLLQEAGYEPFRMFELSAVGVPAGIIGILFILLIGRHLLPDRTPPELLVRAETREYAVRLRVGEQCPLAGRSIEKAGLRSLQGLFLAAIDRGEKRIAPVSPEEVLELGDELQLFGLAETVIELQKIRGLVVVDEFGDDEQSDEQALRFGRRLFEVVISNASPLVGSNLKDASFRRRYDAAVVAIHRGGHRLHEKLGEVTLRAGDTLMVEASPGFRKTWANSSDFYLVAQLEEGHRPRFAQSWAAKSILAVMLVVMASSLVPVLMAVSIAALALIMTRCIDVPVARRSIDLSVLVVIASAFGLSAAVINSGLSEHLAGLMVDLVGEGRPILLLAVVYLTCAITTELLTNSAAAALVFPLALTAAQQQGYDPKPFVIAVAIAASMSFMTPMGYQTNLMVYGPGGYRFSDYLRIGVPMAALMFIVSMIAIPLVWGL